MALFGLGYYWISCDPVANKNIIRLGAVGKLFLVSVGVIEVAVGNISWQMLIPLSGDFIYSILFFRELKTSREIQ